MKAKDIREAVKKGAPVAIGRSHVRGEVPNVLRRAVITRFDGRRVKVRYTDNQRLEELSMRDVYAPWDAKFDASQPKVIQAPTQEGSNTQDAQVRLDEMFIDYADDGGYQRRRTEKEAEDIALFPDEHLWQHLHLSDRRSSPDGSPLGPTGEPYAIIDGGARWLALQLLDRKTAKAEVHYGLTIEDEANLFTRLARNQKNLQGLQLFRADLRGGVEEAVKLDALMKKCGWSIGGSGKKAVSAVGALYWALSYGEEHLALALWLCEPWTEDARVSGMLVEGMTLFVRDYGAQANLDKARRKFAKTPMTALQRRATDHSRLTARTHARGRAQSVCEELFHTYNRGARSDILRAVA